MQSSKQIINSRPTEQLATGKSLRPTEQLATGDEADQLFEQLPDLVNSQFKAWYCKMFYNLGKDRILVLASQARADGKNPARLFSYLLRKELNHANN